MTLFAGLDKDQEQLNSRLFSETGIESHINFFLRKRISFNKQRVDNSSTTNSSKAPSDSYEDGPSIGKVNIMLFFLLQNNLYEVKHYMIMN